MYITIKNSKKVKNNNLSLAFLKSYRKVVCAGTNIGLSVLQV